MSELLNASFIPQEEDPWIQELPDPVFPYMPENWQEPSGQQTPRNSVLQGEISGTIRMSSTIQENVEPIEQLAAPIENIHAPQAWSMDKIIEYARQSRDLRAREAILMKAVERDPKNGEPWLELCVTQLERMDAYKKGKYEYSEDEKKLGKDLYLYDLTTLTNCLTQQPFPVAASLIEKADQRLTAANMSEKERAQVLQIRNRFARKIGKPLATA